MSKSTCKSDSCVGSIRARGFCSKHYEADKRDRSGFTCAVCGEPMFKARSSKPQGEAKHGSCRRADDVCSVSGCAKVAHAKGMCPTHYSREWRGQDVAGSGPVMCALCGGVMKYSLGKSLPLHKACKDSVPLWKREGRSRGELRDPAAIERRDAREALALSLWQGPEPRKDRRGALRTGFEDGDYSLFLSGIRERVVVSGAGCWEWQGRVKGGYPYVGLGGKTVSVHRIVLEAVEGKPLGVMESHHKCANSVCVNPAHLQMVTQYDNIAEMRARNSLEARIRELEAAVFEVAPSHEVLNRVGVSIPADPGVTASF